MWAISVALVSRHADLGHGEQYVEVQPHLATAANFTMSHMEPLPILALMAEVLWRKA